MAKEEKQGFEGSQITERSYKSTNLNKLMATTKILFSKKRRSGLIWTALAGLALAITAPKGARAEGSPAQDNQALETQDNGLRKGFLKGPIKELAGKVLIDGQLEVTQPIQVDKKINFVALSTPSATPSSGHAELWLNNSTRQLCTIFDNGTSGCLATGSAAGTITGVTAGLGLIGGGASGGVTVSLSTPITSSYIPDYVSATAVASATSTLTTRVVSIGVSTASIAVDTGTFLTKSSATATYIHQVTASNGVTGGGTAGNVTVSVSSVSLSSQVVGNLPVGNLNSGTNADATHYWRGDSTWATIAAGGDAVLAATQTWSGANVFNSSVTLSKALLTGSALTAGASGYLLASGGSNTSPFWSPQRLLQTIFASGTTSTSLTSATFTATVVTNSITPTSSSNRVKITAMFMSYVPIAAGSGEYYIARGTTKLASGNGFAQQGDSGVTFTAGLVTLVWIDSPATTSNTTYTVYGSNANATGTITIGNNRDWVMILEEIN